MNSLLEVIAGIGMFLGTALGFYSPEISPPLAAAVQDIAGVTYALSGSGVSASASSIILSSFTIPQTGQKIQDSDLSATFYVTLEPGNRSRQEIVSCTTVTQNANDTATLSGCSRGLAPITPYTASSTLRFSHGGGTQVIFSNPPQQQNQFAAKANNETITGQWTFDTFPLTPSNSTSTINVAGISQLATGAQIAASTATSTNGTNAPLVIPSVLATSTYNAQTAPNRLVVTDSSGALDTDFLGTTTITFGANLSLSGTATSTFGTASTSSFTTAFTWTKPSQLKQLLVKAVGGGAGGAADGSGGGGGGGGAYCEGYIDAAQLGSTETVTIGNVATGVGSTAFGALIIAANGATSTSQTGAAGGDCSGTITKLLKIENFDGTNGVADSEPATDIAQGGLGGGSVYGQGGQGSVTLVGGASGSLNGNDGTGYGSGGGGGVTDGGEAGGAGKQGLLILTEIFN